MARQHIVVDGSNVATEGRSAPSLAQLEEAVAELRKEYPEAEVTVIVDATFAHRIDKSELERFEAAVLEGEYVHPPAGAIGRGDAFLLRIAERVDATVLSNDSFQEFHGEHPWLFERGRLLGATPVPGVGWIFSPRTPVRGKKSRQATKDEKASATAKRKISKAIEAATKEAVAPEARPKERRSSGRAQPATLAATAVVNDPLSFISFIAEHPLGTEVTGEVETYTSHGAVVMVGGTQCYLPLSNMAVPAPRSAREVLTKKERRSFVVTALDPQRRGVELAVPGVAAVSGRPSAEMIEAELKLTKKKARSPKKAAKKTAATKKKAVGGAKAVSSGEKATVMKAAGKAGAAKATAKAGTGGEKAKKSAREKKADPPGGDESKGTQAGRAARSSGRSAGSKKVAGKKKAAKKDSAPPVPATEPAAGPRRNPRRLPG